MRCDNFYCVIVRVSEMSFIKNMHKIRVFCRESSPTIPSARRGFLKTLGHHAMPSEFLKSPWASGDLREDPLQKTRISYTYFFSRPKIAISRGFVNVYPLVGDL